MRSGRIDHLAVLTELVLSVGRQVTAGLVRIICAVGSNNTGGADVIIVIADLGKTLVNDLVVLIVVAVYDTVLDRIGLRNDHLAVRSELIGLLGGQVAVGNISVVVAVCSSDTVGTDIIVVVVNLDKTHISGNALFHIIQVALVLNESVDLLDELTILGESYPCVNRVMRVCVVLNNRNTLGAVALCIEVIIVSVNCNKLIEVIVGTIVVSCAVCGLDPLAVEKLAVIKGVSESVRTVHYIMVGNGAVNACIGSLIEAIPFIINHLPTGDQLIVDRIVIYAVHLEQACAALIGLAAGLAYELIAFTDIAVTGCRNSCAPSYNRVAVLTEGSAGVAVLCAGSINIGKSCNCVCVYCSIIRGLVKFTEISFCRSLDRCGSAGDLCAIGCGQQALFSLCNKPNTLGLGVQYTKCVVAGGRPNSGGQRNKSRLAGSVGIGSACNGDLCNLVIIENFIACSEAVCNNHMIEFPFCCVVEVDINAYAVNRSDIGSNDIQPIKRIKGKVCQRGIVRLNGNSG